MNKEELVNIISARFSSKGRETAMAFDVFLQKVAESLDVNESVKIPEVGIFQLKKKMGIPNEDSSASAAKNSFYLLFLPLKSDKKDKDEVLTFQVNPKNVKKNDVDDDVFSLSVDQPVIPVTEQAKKDFLVNSSYIMMKKNLEEKAENLLSDSVNLSDFNIDYNMSSIPEESGSNTAPSEIVDELLREDNESIPWDFGEEENLKTDEAEETVDENIEIVKEESPEEDFDSIVARITSEFSEETPKAETAKNDFPLDIPSEETPAETVDAPKSETEEVLKEILPEDDSLKISDDLFKDLLGEEELSEEKISIDEPALDEPTAVEPAIEELAKDEPPIEEPSLDEPAIEEPATKVPDILANSELGEDWFNLSEIEEEDETEVPAEEVKETSDNEQPENIEDKLDLLTAMEAGIEMDPFEDFPLDEQDELTQLSTLEEETPQVEEAAEEVPDEEKLEEVLADENLQEPVQDFSGLGAPDLTRNKMLEDEDEEEETAHKVKYPGMFWIILTALILVTAGGGYYFFFMGKKNLPLPDFAKKTPTAVQQPQQLTVKPQIIERDYSIPVTVYKRMTKEEQKALEKPETEANQNTPEVNTSADNTQLQNNPSKDNTSLQDKKENTPASGNKTVPENKTVKDNKPVQENKLPQNNLSQNKTVTKNEAPKAVQQNKTENKVDPKLQTNKSTGNNNTAANNQLNKTPVTKLPEKKTQVNKPVEKNNTQTKNNTVPNSKETIDESSIQPRTDTKNKLIKEYIFTDGKSRYTIQESSWPSVSEAVKRVNHFRSRGLDAYYTKYAPKGEKVWYRVRIGDYPSIEEAENTLRKLK